ncbi:MAG: glycosyltransferase family 1 protein [Phycisphaerales bacterium]|nr:glycosyltransferase family 1 protein [Phycisphaerales bacterium]
MTHSSKPTRVLKFTDTLVDINGVCRFIQNTAATAHRTNRDLTVFTSSRIEFPEHLKPLPNIRNFTPLYARPMPGYDTLDLAIPPMLEMLRAAEDHRPDVIHISTPGAVGMVGMLAAKLMRTPITGVYHTDFPAYIDELFDSKFMSRGCRALMRTFYKQFAAVFSRSADYESRLTSLGINPTKLVRLTPGFDNQQFSASLRDPSIWSPLGVPTDGFKLFFCGRVSTEKNLPVLTNHWTSIKHQIESRTNQPAQLIIIGDGPYRAEMQSKLQDHDAYFLGFKHGSELATLYASCDLFAFPSTTDTLGQVVMESQASGVPVVATDQGGPKEVILHKDPHQQTGSESGLVLPFQTDQDQSDWIDALINLACDPIRRAVMSKAAVEHMNNFSFESSFNHYWSIHQHANQSHNAH